jgi:NADH dehydrogenase [ubiquinone] 1 alpha subcomplex assembly factor 6
VLEAVSRPRYRTMSEIDYCADLVRRQDYDRYLTAQFAPAARRHDLLALYAFNVEIAKTREIVSEPLLGQMRLQWWRDTIGMLYAGETRGQPVADALGRAINAAGLSRRLFDDLIDARETDFDDVPPKTLGDLKRYAERTSGSLTLLALEILGHGGGPALLAGRHVGLAWALVGLLRAIPFHAAQRRLYLPDDLMRAADLCTEDVIAAHSGEALRPVVEPIALAAREHLFQARMQEFVPHGAVAALLPACLADDYLRRLRKAGYDPWRPAISAGRTRRLLALWWHGRRGRF